MLHHLRAKSAHPLLESPGVHAAKALVHGEPLAGYWFNRSKEWAARNRGPEFGYYDFATKYLVHLAPLPALRDLLPGSVSNEARMPEIRILRPADREAQGTGPFVPEPVITFHR